MHSSSIAAPERSLGARSGVLKPSASTNALAKGRNEGAHAQPLGKSVSARELGADLLTVLNAQSVPNECLGRTRFASWGSGPPRAGSTRWRRDVRLEKKCRIFESSGHPATQFKKMYERGDIPIMIKHGTKSYLEWKVPISKLDYQHFLPVFIDGIREKSEPYRFVAREGSLTLLREGTEAKILAAVPQCITPLKLALNTRDPDTVVNALHVLQLLAKTSPLVGESLVPYYRHLLPVLNIFKAKKRNTRDSMDYAQRKQDWRNLGTLIEETLNVLELTGGEDAFVNIKYMVPTYESCVY
ncbi:hypothetical protein FOL47_007124 [Perkinsus chesapeaki]|uniref:Parkin coregulated protein n=1 Tax=Perkinsus chesapeaki TaxID=330153 RepID=A0A7J6MWD7_PERCH|nr:hypothetical protein FOL47_007124 [Perkinsus chesapeaki]